MRVRRQHGQEDTQHVSGLSKNRETPGTEVDESWWEQSFGQPQLCWITQASREVIYLPHSNIQREPRSKLVVQQQQELQQETWGKSHGEEVICRPQQEWVGLVTPPTWRCNCEQHQHDAQFAGWYRNKNTLPTLVRRNLASFTQGLAVCQAEFTPTEQR